MSEATTSNERTVALDIEGMSCASCVLGVKNALGALPEVKEVSVDLAGRSATVSFLDEGGASAEAHIAKMKSSIEKAGYDVIGSMLFQSPSGSDREDPLALGQGPSDLESAATLRAERREAAELKAYQAEKKSFLEALLLSLPLLVLGMSHGGIPFAESQGGVALQLALATAVLVGPGRRFFELAFLALKRKSSDMNTLVAMGVGAAYVHSFLTVIFPDLLPGEAGHFYFEAVGAIVTFVLLGRVLESRARRRLSDAVRHLAALLPSTAYRIEQDGPKEVPISALRKGDKLLIRPGERVPADGNVLSGRSTIDESMMTGESIPVDKGLGDQVSGGTLNLVGSLEVQVLETGERSALGRIIEAVERARGQEAKISRLVDRVSAVFVPIVLVIALLTFVLWLGLGWGSDAAFFQTALERMITVLVIACPCALGLATPAAIAVGVGRGAELGILFGGGQALESAETLRTVLLDKTGTLTEGRPALADVLLGDGEEAERALRALALLEQQSEHPIAGAIVSGAKERKVELKGSATEMEFYPGGGLSGRVDKTWWMAGTAGLMKDHAVEVSPLEEEARKAAGEGKTLVFLARKEEGASQFSLSGMVSVADRVREESQAVIDALHEQGLHVVMVTGDRPETAQYVADLLGIDEVRAEVKPEEKAALVKAFQKEGKGVAMVGDGVNDAPALATADLGIAIGGGTAIAASASDLTLVHGLSGLPMALNLAKATMKTIKRNLFWAFGYNTLGIPLAAGVFVPWLGWTLSPVYASLAMSLSSVSVLLSSLSLRRFPGRKALDLSQIETD